MASWRRPVGLVLFMVCLLVCCCRAQQQTPQNASVAARAAATECVDMMWPHASSSRTREQLINKVMQRGDTSRHLQAFKPSGAQSVEVLTPGEDSTATLTATRHKSKGLVQPESVYLHITTNGASSPIPHQVDYTGMFAATSSDNGPHPDWELEMTVGMGLVNSGARPLVTVEGDAESPTSVTVMGVLTNYDGREEATLWYAVRGMVTLDVDGGVPASLRFNVAPTQCTYASPSGVLWLGTIANLSPRLRDYNMYQLADGHSLEGVYFKAVCQSLEVFNPCGRQATCASAHATTAAACVDFLWPSAPSSLRKALQSLALTGSKGTPATAQLAKYGPGDDNPPKHPFMPAPEGQLTAWSRAVFVIGYAGSPADSGNLDIDKTGALWEVELKGNFNSMEGGDIGEVDTEVASPMLPIGDKPFVQLQGPAYYPTQIEAYGKLRAWRSPGEPDEALNIDNDFWEGDLDVDNTGYFPASHKYDVSAFGGKDPSDSSSSTPPGCQYVNPCGDELDGTVSVAPRLGSFTLGDIIARKWLPKSAVRVVCVLNLGQQLTAYDKLTGACTSA